MQAPPGCAALVHGFHRSDDAAAFGDAVKFSHHGFFNEIGQGFDDVGPLTRVLVLRQAELFVDDELDGHGAARCVPWAL